SSDRRGSACSRLRAPTPREGRQQAAPLDPSVCVDAGLVVSDQQPLLIALPQRAALRPVLVVVAGTVAIDDQRAQAERVHLAGEARAPALEQVRVHLPRDPTGAQYT